jgi:hypothetical protein
MTRARCPRCGQVLKNGQPIHYACLISTIAIVVIIFSLRNPSSPVIPTVSTTTSFVTAISSTSKTSTPNTIVKKTSTKNPGTTSVPGKDPTRTKTPTKPPTISPTRSPTGQPSIKSVNIRGIDYPAWTYCSYERLSLIEKGDYAYVNPSPPTPNRLREKPSLSSTKIGEIPPGRITNRTVRNKFLIIDGPVCADDYIWWYVDYRGLKGWTTEGDKYWILPILEERH